MTVEHLWVEGLIRKKLSSLKKIKKQSLVRIELTIKMFLLPPVLDRKNTHFLRWL